MTTQTTTGVGRVARVTGPVVDVEFPVEAMPALNNALHVNVSFDTGEGGGGDGGVGDGEGGGEVGGSGGHDGGGGGV